MNDIIDNARRTAIQRYRKGKVERYAYCPKHGRKTSDYLGLNEKGMMFRCPTTNDHMSHLFYARVPRGIPARPEEIPAWIEKEKQKEIGGQG